MRRLSFAFENLAPPRTNPAAPHQVRALANLVHVDDDRPRPRVLGLAEAIGHLLPRLGPYSLPITDRRRASRANIALYVLGRLSVEHRWVDLDLTWPRTDHPGVHPPRSILVADVEDWRVIVGHAPPVAPRSRDARREWLDAMLNLLDVHGPVLALTDPNGLGDELVRQSDGRVVSGGSPGEAVHGRGVVLDRVLTPNAVNGVPMLTDHGRALLGQARRFVHE